MEQEVNLPTDQEAVKDEELQMSYLETVEKYILNADIHISNADSRRFYKDLSAKIRVRFARICVKIALFNTL